MFHTWLNYEQKLIQIQQDDNSSYNRRSIIDRGRQKMCCSVYLSVCIISRRWLDSNLLCRIQYFECTSVVECEKSKLVRLQVKLQISVYYFQLWQKECILQLSPLVFLASRGLFFDRESLCFSLEEFQSCPTVCSIHTEHEIFPCSVVNKAIAISSADLVSEPL